MQKNQKTHLKPKTLTALFKLENIRKNNSKGKPLTDKQINTIIRGYVFKDLIDVETQNNKLWHRLEWIERKLDSNEEAFRAAVNTKNLEIEETYVKFYNAVRSYNSLFYFGKIARSLGIKMKNYNGELPENQPDFDPPFTQEVMEDGTIIHKSKYKKRKK